MPAPIACADFTFPLLEHQHVLELIRMLGFDGVDIGLFEGRSHLQPSDQFDDPDARGKELGKQLSDRGLRCADVFLQCDPDFHAVAINHSDAGIRQKARKWFDQTLDYAAAAGAEHITVLPGVLQEGEDPEACWQRAWEELAWRQQRAATYGIAFGTEAHVGSLAPDPAGARKLAEGLDGLRLTLDYTHFTRDGVPDDQIEPLLKHANHFHLRGACQGRLQAKWGDNTIDYGRVLEQMLAVGYRGYVGIEYVWIDWEGCNEVDNLSETIRWRDFVRERTANWQLAGV